MAIQHITPLLDIQSAEFAEQYELGIYWAMHGDEQGNGPQLDSYLITNWTSHMERGHFRDLESPWFPWLGFHIGMVHGGIICPQTSQQRPNVHTLVMLHDPDFTRGYHAGREWYFFEAHPDERRLNDVLVMKRFHESATEQYHYHDPQSTLNFTYGSLIGELSGQPFPMSEQECREIEEENRRFLAAYEAQHRQPAAMQPHPVPIGSFQKV